MSALENIEFHDSSLLSLELNLDNNSLIMLIELEFGSNSIELCFSNIRYFSLDGLDNFKDIQIYSANFLEKNEFFEANFILLNGFGGKSYSFTFQYLNCVVNR